jgi:uncharacterized protein YfaS (alpha-2-macroglobulin family)/tetratricopeptide (TPR) repeat protein
VQRSAAGKAFQNRNYADALKIYEQLVGNPQNNEKAALDLAQAVQCMQRLNRTTQIDGLVDQTVKLHGRHWEVLEAAANVYLTIPHYGFVVENEFRRGSQRGGGEYRYTTERDRAIALQYFRRTIPLIEADAPKSQQGAFYLRFANAVLHSRQYQQAWQLSALTDLENLPEMTKLYAFGSPVGTPVDSEGNPLFYTVPTAWQDAENDGQRWRWLLAVAEKRAPELRSQVLWRRAQFCQSQFGVQLLANFPTDRQIIKVQEGKFALATLKDTETITRLANGVRRLTLPDEFNHLRLFQQLTEDEKGSYWAASYQALASVYKNRRQFPRAAEQLKQILRRTPNHTSVKRQLDDITGNWGVFEASGSQPAGRGATFDFRFRNANSVSFVAQEIHVESLLKDIRSYLRAKPTRLDWQKIQIGNIGWNIIRGNSAKYVGQKVASWDLELEPLAKHFDRRVNVTTPLQKGGAYLVTAKVADGNTCQIVLWVDNAVMIRKPLDGKHYYYVADAVDGGPLAFAQIEMFGYRVVNNKGRQQMFFREMSGKADRRGQYFPPGDKENYQWIAIARGADGELAFMGFQRLWAANHNRPQFGQTKAFGITDRPVYRPGDRVKFKFWIRDARYELADVSRFANKSASYTIRDPQGEQVADGKKTTDAYGGFGDEFALPNNAKLGVYYVQTPHGGAVSFRVEEYKKPEFEVTIAAPKKPVKLGEKITATLKAKYYFGSPVTVATVKYKVMRTERHDSWYPYAPWDWCFGPGYWWFGSDYEWYPGWGMWRGCKAPHPYWWPRWQSPPEIVAEVETTIGPDGELKIEIDTALAKEIFGDRDHEYTITAEVRDDSRRTIVGQGKVIVARKPFTVYTWLNRGYYRSNQVVNVNVMARDPAGTPVVGKGTARLFEISYDADGKPQEEEVESWDVETNEEGSAQWKFNAGGSGQYRLSTIIDDGLGHEIEGGYIFTVAGNNFSGREFRYNALELVPDKREYAPGDKVRLQVNSNHPDATVLLFIRPENGVYDAPRILRLDGKSRIVELGVARSDMPNFHVEAVCIFDSQVHTVTREIIVPPEKRMLNVEVQPSAEQYLPGTKAKVRLHITDHTGESYSGSLVVAVYDKSVEYISGGSNVTDIREFFWKWRRQHHPYIVSSLAQFSQNLVPTGQRALTPLGIFGNELEQDFQGRDKGVQLANASEGMKRSRGFAKGGLGGAESAGEMAMAADADSVGSAGGVVPNVPKVRKSFADTAYWVSALNTDDDGFAEVEIAMPENLTTWKIRTWAISHGTRVGQGEAEVITRKNVILRMQTPRFVVERDEVVLSANVHNYLPEAVSFAISIVLPEGLLTTSDPITRNITIEANGEARVDWRARVLGEGEAKIQMVASSDVESDAMEMSFPCNVHGALRTQSWAGTVPRGKDSMSIKVEVPAQRRVDQSELIVQYSPSLAVAMVDALPYLAAYPYGCTEQTLNRFVPAVVTRKTLLDMDLDLKAIRDKRTNLNAQELGDAKVRASQWKRFASNPVFDEEELDDMIAAGITRLSNMQNPDGGWGWFGGSRSYPHTTAVVVHGLQIATESDAEIPPDLLASGIRWLKRYQLGEVNKLQNGATETKPYKRRADDTDALFYMLLCEAGQPSDAMRDFLFRDRSSISVYGLTVYALGLHFVEEMQKLKMVQRNIEQYLVQDADNETAYLDLPIGGYWWYWYGNEVETHAYYLKLLARVEPKAVKTQRLAKYLVNQRKHSTYWNSTRDTATCIEAFAAYLAASEELKGEMTVEVVWDGKVVKTVVISPDSLFTYDNRFTMSAEALTTGEHEIELRRKGDGPVYFNAYLSVFDKRDMIPSAGLEVKVRRNYYRLVPKDATTNRPGADGRAVKGAVDAFDRIPIDANTVLNSGDLIEVELVVTSKNDYEYLLLEDYKPAGFEAVNVRSGYDYQGITTYREYRDNRVAIFVHRLPRGERSIRYTVRAEIPGRFSALPTQITGMYAPELRGNSDENKVSIK